MMMLICPFDNLPQRADRWLLALIAAQGDRELRNEHILPQVTGPSLNGLNRGKNREQEVHHKPEGVRGREFDTTKDVRAWKQTQFITSWKFVGSRKFDTAKDVGPWKRKQTQFITPRTSQIQT